MVLSDGLKKIFLAGVGAAATTAEAAKDLVDQLVAKGELTVEQGKVHNEELRHNVKEKVNDHVTVNIIREYKDVIHAVDRMNKEERDLLRARLNAADAADEASSAAKGADTADETASAAKGAATASEAGNAAQHTHTCEQTAKPSPGASTANETNV